jgi:dTDP-4-dehydrorhamnose 3,5-epimerase
MAALDGVLVVSLKVIPDDRGQVMHVMRADAPHFKQFGETYVSCIYPNVVKAWKLHSKMWNNISVPVGRVKFVLHDLREGSPTNGQTQEVFLGDSSYQLLTIPPGIAYGWKNLLPSAAYLVNCASEYWQEGEGKTLPPDHIPYQW